MTPTDLLPDAIQWWQVVLALLSVILGWVLGRLAKRGLLVVSKRTHVISPGGALLAARIVQYTILLLGVGVGLAFIGANVQPLLAVVIILAVILALVLRGTAENFAAGVLIQTRQPVRIGEEVEVPAPEGTIVGSVTELNGRSVILITVDGRTVHVPNAHLLSETVVNHSRHGARRSAVSVRVARATDVAVPDILASLVAAVAEAEGVHTRENPRAMLVSVSPERVVADVQFWHHPTHGAAVSAAAVLSLSADLERRGWTATVSSEQAPPPLTPPEQV